MMEIKCNDIVEFMGCKYWLDEDCPHRDKKGNCTDQTRLEASKEIVNCLASG